MTDILQCPRCKNLRTSGPHCIEQNKYPRLVTDDEGWFLHDRHPVSWMYWCATCGCTFGRGTAPADEWIASNKGRGFTYPDALGDSACLSLETGADYPQIIHAKSNDANLHEIAEAMLIDARSWSVEIVGGKQALYDKLQWLRLYMLEHEKRLSKLADDKYPAAAEPILIIPSDDRNSDGHYAIRSLSKGETMELF